MILIIEAIGVPFRSSLGRNLVAAAFALLLFMSGVFAGSATSMILYGDMDSYSYIFKPVYWLGFYGFLPAVIIGLMGAAILRKIGRSEGGEGNSAALRASP